MSRFWEIVRRATLADWFVVASVGVLLWALLAPTLAARAFQARVSAAVTDVDVVTAAAQRALASGGRWPAAAPPGEAPPELNGLGGPDGPFTGVGYTLAWQTWLVVDSVEVPPEPPPPPTPGDPPRQPPGPVMVPVNRAVGSVRVQAEDALLAELVRHYGAGSFVLDSVWVLVLPQRAEPPAR